ncbi:MAG: hypothetical protein M3O32_08650 [Actinomycetota bacterium]|nr:hypothetical protein [Actinomycetota bacterium]
MPADNPFHVSLDDLEASAGHRPETWHFTEAMPDPEPPPVHAVAMTPMTEVYALGDLAKAAAGPASRGRVAGRAFVVVFAAFPVLSLLSWVMYWLRHT